MTFSFTNTYTHHTPTSSNTHQSKQTRHTFCWLCSHSHPVFCSIKVNGDNLLPITCWSRVEMSNLRVRDLVTVCLREDYQVPSADTLPSYPFYKAPITRTLAGSHDNSKRLAISHASHGQADREAAFVFGEHHDELTVCVKVTTQIAQYGGRRPMLALVQDSSRDCCCRQSPPGGLRMNISPGLEKPATTPRRRPGSTSALLFASNNDVHLTSLNQFDSNKYMTKEHHKQA
jgi:hypothetical protein